MKLIAFTGRAGSGKDTTAEALAHWLRERGIWAERRGFADKMKIAGMRAIFGNEFSDQELIEAANDLKKKGAGVAVNFVTFQGGRTFHVDGRTFWQYFGTESLRGTYGDDFHIDALLPVDRGAYLIDHVVPNFTMPGNPRPDVGLITDLRFENEAERVRLFNGEVWEILRPNAVTGLAEGKAGHVSEQGVPDDLIELTIKNTAPRLADYVEQLRPIFESWFERSGLEAGSPLLVDLPRR